MYSKNMKLFLAVSCMVAALLSTGQEGYAEKMVFRIDEFDVAESAKPYLQNVNFQDLLKAEINKLGKIEAAKRDDLRTAVEEIQNSQSGLFDTNTAQKLGGFKSAQLAIGGALELIDRNKPQGVKKQYTARAVLKITKVATATEETRTTELTDFAQSPADLFGPLAAQLAREFTLSTYPIKVAAVDGTSAVLNYGSSILERGDMLAFFDLAVIKDPDTGEVISSGSKRAGALRVTSVDERSATAEIVEGTPGVGTKCMLEAPSAETEATAAVSGKKAIPVTGEKPTMAIGKFKYSNEFDLSQTADRTGKPITSAGAGQGSGAVLGAIAGGLIKGGKPKEWLGGAAVGALAGQTVDSERRKYEHGDDPHGAQMPSDQAETAIEKESQVLREMVVTKAQKSGKFTLIEQTRKDEIKGQMDNEMDGDYSQADLVQRGKMQSAKYSAFGTITRFETYRKQQGYSIAGGNETLTMKLTLDMRLVDNELGAVVGSDQVTGQIDTASSQTGVLGFGSASESQGEIGQLLDNLAQNIVAKIVTTIWPIKIIAVNADEKVVMINAGETVVSPGLQLIVYGQGNQVVDPETGEVLGSEEMTVGEVEVFETQVKFSKCNIIKPIQRPGDLLVGQICRPLEVATAGGAVQAPESKPKFEF